MQDHKTTVNHLNTDRRGFTLIELLVVITVVAALAAVAIPRRERSPTPKASVQAQASTPVPEIAPTLAQPNPEPLPAATADSQMTINEPKPTPSVARSVEVMFYNVENLFDPVHEAGKEDWEYTPKDTAGKVDGCNAISIAFYRDKCLKSDWTEARLALKIEQIKRMLTEGRARAPDVLGLTEIKNAVVAERLAKATGYDVAKITESPDGRGIDVALLVRTSSDVKVDAVHEHPLPFAEVEPQFKNGGAAWEARHILEAELSVFGKRVYLFANHWPSQYYPSAYRAWYAEQVSKLIQARMSVDPRARVILGGDFNTATGEAPDPSAALTAAAAGTALLELDVEVRKLPELVSANDLPPGSYYFPGKAEWNLLDRVFFSRSLTEGELTIPLSSYEIVHPEFASLPQSTPHSKFHGPKRYNFLADSANAAGFSDHFPVLFRIEPGVSSSP